MGDGREGLTRPAAINKRIVDAGEMEHVSLRAGEARRAGVPASARCGGRADGRALARRSYGTASMVLWRGALARWRGARGAILEVDPPPSAPPHLEVDPPPWAPHHQLHKRWP